MKKLILAIETSCDETGVALVEARSTGLGQASGSLGWPKFKILKNLVSSQVKIHAPFGGVVPNLAKREHLKNLPILFERIRNYELGIMDKIDLIAVTVGPGLEPALWTGIGFAKSLTNADKTRTGTEKNRRKSAPLLVGVNHLEGHLYSFLLPSKRKRVIFNNQFSISERIFPAIALIVSGGHTILLLVKDLKTWRRLGETRDDAVGEAFDKVARMLDLPYPGGPALEKLARTGKPRAIEFPRPMMHEKSYDFSFSGLKTSVLYYLRDHKRADKADVAASFQAVAVDVLVKKTLRAVAEFSSGGGSAFGGGAIKSVILSGGVAANQFLRVNFKKETKKLGVNFLVAEQKYNTDNAVMIAVAGYINSLRKKKYPLKASGNLGI